MKKLPLLFCLIFLFSCNLYQRKAEVYMTDEDFVEFRRHYSPDSTRLLLRYGIDQGAFGTGHRGTAVLRLADTTKELTQFTLPNTLMQVEWLDDQNASAKVDIFPGIRSGKPVQLRDTLLNGVRVKVSALDYIEPGYHREIEYREISPDGRYELVAYRYLQDRSNLNFIHVSVLPTGQPIPKYGNYLIADMYSDYALSGRWAGDNTIEFYSNSLYADMLPYFLVKNRPDMKYRTIADDQKYVSRSRWTGTPTQ